MEGGADALAQISRPTHGGGGGVPASSETTSRGRRGHGRPAPDFYVVSLRKKKKRKKEISPLLRMWLHFMTYIYCKSVTIGEVGAHVLSSGVKYL